MLRIGRVGQAIVGIPALALMPGTARAEPASASLDASANAGYASNLFFLSPVEARSGRFPSIDDYVFTPELGAALRAPVGRQVFELKATAAYRFHRYNRQIDALDYDVAGKLIYALGTTCTGTLAIGQERNQTDYTDLATDRPLKVVVRDRTADGVVNCAVTPEIGTQVSVDYRSQANSRTAFAIYDLDRTTVYAEVNYGLPDTGQGFVAGRYRYREQPLFVSRLFPDGLTGRIVDAGGGARFAPSGDVDLSAELFWTQLRETSGRRNSTGLSAAAKAIYAISPKTKFTLAADTGLDVSPNIGAIAFRATTTSLEANWQPTPKIEATIQASYVWRAILRDFGPGSARELTRHERDRTLNLGGNVNYRLTDRLVVRLAGGYRDRRGNFEDITFRAATATLGLTYRFEGPPLDSPAS